MALPDGLVPALFPAARRFSQRKVELDGTQTDPDKGEFRTRSPFGELAHAVL